MVSFDTWAARLPRIEVYGSDGSLSVPGPQPLRRRGRPVPRRCPASGPPWTPSAGYLDGGRGIGVADLALGIEAGTPHRADADLALHVLDVMESVLGAADAGGGTDVATTCERPDPVPGLVDLAGPVSPGS